jgi:hypothetical protein
MDNNELDNVEQNAEGLDAGQVGLWVGVGGFLFGIGMGIKAWISRRALKKEREKNALYQEAIRKHQAEINALKNDREREEYKNRLWEELKARSEE